MAKLRLTSFDPEYFTKDEAMEMEKALYEDIPAPIRHAYSEQEKIWTKKDAVFTEYHTSQFPDPFGMIPVGINSEIAVGLSNMSSKKANMAHTELQLFVASWNATLRRSRFRLQFEELMKRLIQTANVDENLKPGIDFIVRDEKLLAFRDALPEVAKDPEIVGLSQDLAEREDSVVTTVSVKEPEKPEESGGSDVFVFYTNRYNTQRVWKDAFTFKSSSLPGYALCEKYLMYAYYVEPIGPKATLGSTLVCVKLYQFPKKVITEWYCRLENVLNCAVNDNGVMAVTDGKFIYQKSLENPIIYRYNVENQLITSIHMDMSNHLMIGTLNGQIYDVNPFKIRSYSKMRDCTPVLTIYGGKKMVATNIGGLLCGEKYFAASRPLTAHISGTLVIFLSKYGVLRIRSLVHEQICVDFAPPKNVQTTMDCITPWYDAGIYFDAKKLAVLYPNGVVVVKILQK